MGNGNIRTTKKKRFSFRANRTNRKSIAYLDISLVGSKGTIVPILHSGHMTELTKEPNSVGSRHRRHRHEKYH
jgi:hypothetical protein